MLHQKMGKETDNQPEQEEKDVLEQPLLSNDNPATDSYHAGDIENSETSRHVTHDSSPASDDHISQDTNDMSNVMI